MKKFAMIGAGFWARCQLAGWAEVPGARCVAITNRNVAKAEVLAAQFGGMRVYADAAEMLEAEALDFVDIVTNVETHAAYVEMAAARGLDVITQKPMAPTLAEATRMVSLCQAAGVRLSVHENWRWQAPIRELKRVLDSGVIGRVFRAGVDMISGFPVFRNQPFLADLDQFILTDLGTHTLDAARFLFGEASSLYCVNGRAHEQIKGEDVATVVLTMGEEAVPVIVRLAYAENFVERECFPQTLFFVEGTLGSVEIAPDYMVRVTTREGTQTRRVPPVSHPWVDPLYAVVQSSIVPCCANLLDGMSGGLAETTGEDNLRTLRLVFAAYDSAASGSVIRFSH